VAVFHDEAREKNAALCQKRQEHLDDKYRGKTVRSITLTPGSQGGWNVPVGADRILIHFTDDSVLKVEPGSIDDEREGCQALHLLLNNAYWPEEFPEKTTKD
jgi:hypothetical protein